MSEGLRPGQDETAVVVEVTPSNYRLRALVFVGLGVVLIIVTVVLTALFDREVQLFLPFAAVSYGIYCAVQARRQVTSTLVRIDSSGVRGGDGVFDHSWAGVVLVWVGSSSGLRLPVAGQVLLSVFTQAGIDFAGRAGTRPQSRYNIPVGRHRSIPDLCDRLSRLTDATVIDGTRTSRRAAAASLPQPARAHD